MGKKIIQCIPLPTELILEIFSYIPTRQLCKFMILSRSMNTEIRKILILRFNDTFWNSHRRLLVLMTRYLLDFVPINNTFDFQFHKFDKTTLHATFTLDTTQPTGTLGPNHSKLWGLKLRGDGILRDNFINEPLLYSDWDCPTELNESRIYVFDSETDKEHPFLKTFFVTNGQLKTPTNECKSTDGLWNSYVTGRGKNKLPKAKFIGRNKKKMEDEDDDNNNNSSSSDNNNNNNNNNSSSSNNINNNSSGNNDNNNNNNNNNNNSNNNNNNNNNGHVLGVIESVIIKAPMLMASIEEKIQDKYLGGVKFIVLEGGQKYLKKKKTCTIS
ncbi:hypothetical protein Glove_714g3 [Diversispora epigaea]|uniref:F-box domain-containing protein n=1 Tax=Diversispora epigaea TaxID=1348612 RepID=A0A397G5L7_9GLOM|nr:hypothetical protein Glove_714g3 [Diversispora epigaea]